jgi:voltage-gated potassium channel
MQSSFKRIFIGLAFFAITMVGAVIGYMMFGWSLLDAVYMVVITIFGVGYGEVRPLSDPYQKMFTMGVIIAGTSSAVYAVGGFVQMVTEGEIHRALDDHRKCKGIEKLSNHVIICGFGRIGQILCQQMSLMEQPFIVLDQDSDRLASAESLGYLSYCGNATNEMDLDAVGIRRARFLATVLPDDAANVFITLTAREMNPDLVILARGELPSTEKKLRLAGADHVVLPASISALRMANLITRPNALDFLDEKGERRHLEELLAQIDIQIDELEIPSGSPFAGRSLQQLEVRGNGTFIVVAVREVNGNLITHPDHSLTLKGGDTVILMGHRGDIPQFARSHHLKKQMRYRGASMS